MIAFLKGKIIDVNSESAVLDIGGVGYEIHCSLSTLAELQIKLGLETCVWVYTHVREDALVLFGFLTQSEKQFYLSLLKVNGIGPKMAINLMSGASVEAIIEMIENEDVKAISKLPKVGKKTAEQLILTLKGKLVLAPTEAKANSKSPSYHKPHSDVESALMNLGFKTADVQKVLSELPADILFEDGVRRGLALLSGGH
jgi:holliday junction DNA helicase RuvA